MPLKWTPAPDSEFLGRSADIDVKWAGSFAYTDTRVRRARISSREEWAEFSGDAVLPWYKAGGGWNVLGSVNYTLAERAREPFPPPTSEADMTLLTAFHCLLQKRLIADGVKRALKVEKMFQAGEQIPEVSVIECYGTQVHVTFWPDFLNVVTNAAR